MNTDEQRRIAEHFERMWRQGVTPWLVHKPEPLLQKYLKPLKNKFGRAKVLDIGCGNGWISLLAAKEGHEVWGIDSPDEAIKEANHNAKEAGLLDLAHFQVGDALNLPYEDSFFDALVDRGLFHYILPENRSKYLENILQVLKPKSLVYLFVFSDKNPLGIGQLFTKELVEKIFGSNFKIQYFKEDPYPTDAPAHLLHFILERK